MSSVPAAPPIGVALGGYCRRAILQHSPHPSASPAGCLVSLLRLRYWNSKIIRPCPSRPIFRAAARRQRAWKPPGAPSARFGVHAGEDAVSGAPARASGAMVPDDKGNWDETHSNGRLPAGTCATRSHLVGWACAGQRLGRGRNGRRGSSRGRRGSSRGRRRTDGQHIGSVRQLGIYYNRVLTQGRVTFTYSAAWAFKSLSVQLSSSPGLAFQHQRPRRHRHVDPDAP